MDGNSSRGPPLPRERLPPPPHESSYRSMGAARDDTLRMRLHPDPAQRYPRSEIESHLPTQARTSTAWADHEATQASGSYGMRAEPMLSHRPIPPYPRAGDPSGPRSAPYPPSDLPRPSWSARPADDYYAAPQHGMTSLRDSGSTTASRPFHRRPSHYEEDALSMTMPMSDSRDPYRSPKRHPADPKPRQNGYAEPPYYHSRPPLGHTADPRSDYPPPARARSPGEMQAGYPVASPPRRVSNASPPYPVGLADDSRHRGKRARLDLYSERAQPGPDTVLRPPPLRASSSYRSAASIASTSTGWVDGSDMRERRPRDGVDGPFHIDGGSKGMRNVEWAETERASPGRRPSTFSHHTLDAATTASSEVQSITANPARSRDASARFSAAPNASSARSSAIETFPTAEAAFAAAWHICVDGATSVTICRQRQQATSRLPMLL